MRNHPVSRQILMWIGILLSAFSLLLVAENVGAEWSETVTYYHTDGLGSVIAASDESGNLLWRERYRPFGERLEASVSTDDHALYYTGKPHNDDTGLTYFGARYYDPVVGRFMGIDPAGIAPGNLHSFNRYAYANNNPYRYVDPDGRNAFSTGYQEATPEAKQFFLGKVAPVLFSGGVVGATIEIASQVTGIPYLSPKQFIKKGVAKNAGKELVPYYPPNRGFLGNSEKINLQPGAKVDRYGFDGGTFVAPVGTPAAMRALPPGTLQKPYSSFEVQKAITVDGGRTAPAFGQVGLGVQYELPSSVNSLLKSGTLKRINK